MHGTVIGAHYYRLHFSPSAYENRWPNHLPDESYGHVRLYTFLFLLLFCCARPGLHGLHPGLCELTFATRISLLSGYCFYQLRQLLTVTRSLVFRKQAQPLYMLSLKQTTTVARYTLAYLHVDWDAWIGSCVLLPA